LTEAFRQVFAFFRQKIQEQSAEGKKYRSEARGRQVMKAVIGLGNPGPQYAVSRHNAGFLAIDRLAEDLGLVFKPRYQGLTAEAQIAGEKVFFLKPQTFMNLSGRSVRELAAFYKLAPEDILVLHDDLDLPLGKIRLRQRGGAGGHNGLRSLMAELGTENFWRLKIGVSRPPEQWDTADYVLAPFSNTELTVLNEVLERVQKAVMLWLGGEHVKAMNLYNR
jgi:PTH1 family peptidyl-tRNA hydrolase